MRCAHAGMAGLRQQQQPPPPRGVGVEVDRQRHETCDRSPVLFRSNRERSGTHRGGRGDGSHVVVRQLLPAGRHVARQGPATELEVRALVVPGGQRTPQPLRWARLLWRARIVGLERDHRGRAVAQWRRRRAVARLAACGQREVWDSRLARDEEDLLLQPDVVDQTGRLEPHQAEQPGPLQVKQTRG